MRTSVLLPFVCLFGLGKTLSFPGTRQEQLQPPPVVPEQAPKPSDLSPLTEPHGVVFVKKSSHARTSRSHELSPTTTTAATSPDQQHLDAPKEEEDRLQQLQQQRRKTTFAVSLAALSGVLDVVCFARFGCFAHLMTGNTVKSLVAVTERQWREAAFYAAVVASYTTGAAGYRCVDIWQQRRRRRRRHEQQREEGEGQSTREKTATIDINDADDDKPHATLSTLAGILLPVFALSDVFVRVWDCPASVVAVLWAFGCGVVNASTVNAIGVVTNAVTGHWNKLGAALADHVITGKPWWDNVTTKTSCKVMAATALGVCGTTWLMKFLSLRSKFVPPMGLIIGMMYFRLFRWYGSTPQF